MLAAVERGVPRSEVAAAFGVSPATIKRWLARRRSGGDGGLAPGRPSGRPPKVRAEELGELRAQLGAHPCATLEEHRSLWEAEREARLSIHAVRRAIGRLGWTRKKGRWGPPSATR